MRFHNEPDEPVRAAGPLTSPRLDALQRERRDLERRSSEILRMDAADLTDEQTTEADRLRSRLVGLDAELADERDTLERRQRLVSARAADFRGSAVITSEPRTYMDPEHYSRSGDIPSFFADMYRAQTWGDPQAQQRIQRHYAEAERSGEMVSERATTTSSFAGLVVPQYLVDRYALVLRTGRPAANILAREQLPEQGMQFLVPRGTTGASAAAQTTENTAVSSTDEAWSNVTVSIATIAGQQDVSRQSLERGSPGIDAIIFLDLTRAYAAELDNEVLNGSGASGQMLGLRNTAGITQASAFTAAVTVPTFISKTAGIVNSLASVGTQVTPNYWLMHPRRWYWLTSQVDTTNRPLVEPEGQAPMNPAAVVTYPGGYSGDGDGPARPVGFLHGLPVVIDANVAASVGTGPEDQVYLLDSTQHILWEDVQSGGMPRQARFEQTLSGQLTVKLVAWGYCAVTFGRYPTAVGVVGGNAGTAGFGLVNPTF